MPPMLNTAAMPKTRGRPNRAVAGAVAAKKLATPIRMSNSRWRTHQAHGAKPKPCWDIKAAVRPIRHKMALALASWRAVRCFNTRLLWCEVNDLKRLRWHAQNAIGWPPERSGRLARERYPQRVLPRYVF